MNDKKESFGKHIDPYCFISYVMKHFWMVILAMLTSVMAVYLVQTLCFSLTYTSSVTFSVTVKRAVLSSSVNSVAVTDTVAEQFGELLQSDIMRNAAAEQMGRSDFPAQVAITVPEDTNIIRMSVTASSPELAYRSALAIVNCHGEYSSAIFSSIVLDTLDGPSVPASASNLASRQRILTFSAPLGGLCMIALLVLLFLRADTVQTPAGAKRQIDGKLLATVFHERKRGSSKRRLSGKKASPLISDPTRSFYYTETIHRLRIQLERAGERDGHRIFMICSCTENEGKSTLAANLALSLAQKHRRVLLLDADLRRPSQASIFDEKHVGHADISAFLGRPFARETLMDAIRYSDETNLHILHFSAAGRRRLEALTPESFSRLMATLREEFSYVIVDTPPIGLFADTGALAEVVDASVLVVRQNLVSAIAVNDAIDDLLDARSEFLGYVLNNFRSFRTSALPGYAYGSYDRYGGSDRRNGKGGD